MTSFSNWLEDKDLKGKITLALVVGSLTIAALVASASFLYFRHLLVENMQQTANAEARIEKREVELLISGTLSQLESLAANTVTANALADSTGRETYLIPLFSNLKFPVTGISVALTDYRGKTIVRNGDDAFGGLDPAALVKAVGNGIKPRAMLSRGAHDRPILTVAMPVIYRLTGNVEGLVIVGIPLESVIARPSRNADLPDSVKLRLEGGTSLATGSVPDASSIATRVQIDLPPLLEQLPLSLITSISRATLERNLWTMIGIYILSGLLISAIVLLLAKRAALGLSAPLSYLSTVAEEIAASGRPNISALPAGKDEFGRLAQAFNRMVERLAESHRVLEAHVEDRTHALRHSEARLRYVMDATGEGIWDWNVRTGLVIHNATWCQLLRLSVNFLEHDIQQFAEVLHPDDREETLARVQNCLRTGEPYYHEHRMLRPDGSVIWVLDRGAVVELDANGEAVRMVGSISDITARRIASSELIERELYLRATLDNLPFIFWLKDAKGRFLAVNKRFAEACGRSLPDRVIGLTDFDVWPQDLAEQYHADDAIVMQTRTEKAVEEPVASEPVRRWIETYKKPVISSDGTILGTVGFARDITERKNIERQLAASEQRWELAVSGANDGIWDWMPETGEMIVSARWSAMLDYTPDELEPRIDSWHSRIHPDDQHLVLAALQDHIEHKTDFYQTEQRLRCKDGSYKWVLSRGRALFDGSGKAIRMSGSHTDITESRNARSRLQDRTEQLNAIFALSPDGFISFDRDHRVKYVSQAFLRMSGYTEEELVGLSEDGLAVKINDLCDAEVFPSLTSLIESSEGPAVHNRELIELTHPTKRVLEVGIRTSLAETVSQILYFRDVTHETEVDRMKSEFLSTAAHELRTPMASVYGFSELLLAQEFDTVTQRELLGTIFRQSQLMASIINELLDLARIEARRGKDFVIERIEAGALIKLVIEGFKVPDGRLLPVVGEIDRVSFLRGDRNKLVQSLTNVLSNAYKYSPNGGEVRITIETAEKHPNMLGLRVVDQGIGMTPEQVTRVGERFYRADTSGKIPGTGLGMAIVKEIAELHRGHLEIASQPRQGTCVTLWVPSASGDGRRVSA